MTIIAILVAVVAAFLVFRFIGWMIKFAPRRRIVGTTAIDSTLLTVVGQP